jgi:L-aminopeptidase/D-esterase-like protein
MNSNDHLQLAPKTSTNGRRLAFDFPDMLIGTAEYEEAPTGCTVFYFPKGVKTAVDVRCKFAGTVNNYDFNHAICFAGGSLLGLEAASGVSAGIFARLGYSFDETFPFVSGAILYDYASRENRIYPDAALGRAALDAAQTDSFPIGQCGAGRSATVGGTFDDDWREPSGQGAAFRHIGGVKIGVFVVVNASGGVHDRTGSVIAGNLEREKGSRHTALSDLERRLAEKNQPNVRQGNTTLTLVVTNQKLEMDHLTQVARQVHSSLARVIQPFHTIDDGDVLYAVTTDEVEEVGTTTLGMLASELAWDAVLSIYRKE